MTLRYGGRWWLLCVSMAAILWSQLQLMAKEPTPSSTAVWFDAPLTTATGLPSAMIDEALVERLSRVWPHRSYQEWCGAEDHGGILLVKVPKSASSTIAGLALRMGQSSLVADNCTVVWQHRSAIEYRHRPQSSLLLGVVREPSSRALSWFYFHLVSFHHQRQPPDERIIGELQRDQTAYADYTVRYLSLDEVRDQGTLEQRIDRVQTIVHAYDFILVVDRLVESAVVLANLTGLPMEDVLTSNAKTAGSLYLAGSGASARCIPLAEPVLTEGLQAYFTSDDWLQRNYGDRLLHAVANRSLDRTMDAIGRDWVEQHVQRWHEWQDRLAKVCRPDEVERPCSADGQPQVQVSRQTCYARDFGCGYRCLDRLIDEQRPSTVRRT